MGEEVANKKGDVTKQFVNTKLMTRQTYTLDGISGKLEGGGGITFTEEDGIDYAPTTVQLPGGERVPFLFTIKELVAKGQGSAFKPGYEFGTFLTFLACVTSSTFLTFLTISTVVTPM